MSHAVFMSYYGAIFQKTNSMDMADVGYAFVLCNDGSTYIKHHRRPVWHGRQLYDKNIFLWYILDILHTANMEYV